MSYTDADFDKAAEDALHTNPLVAALKKQKKETVALSGYLEHLQGNRYRLYRSLNLNEYLEFEDGPDVVFVFQVDEDKQQLNDPKSLEPAIVWFTPDAKVDVSFLVGSIASLYMPRADAGLVLGQVSQTVLLANSVAGGCTTNPGCGGQ